MSHPAPYPVRLADEITRQLGQLADHLSQLPPTQAAQVIARVLDPDAGVLGAVTHLVATGSVFAKDQAERGALPAEVWLALGRASNELHDITLDLDEHKDTLQHVGTQPATTAAKPPGTRTARRTAAPVKEKQWQGWGPGEQAEQHYLVQPRALAGGGDVRHVSEFLRASGWRDKSKTNGPLLMESPDRTVRVAYDPYVLPGGWTVHGQAEGPSGAWSAHLGRQTPVEIVAGLTDALTRPGSAHAPNVWAPLEEQNWHTRFEGEHYTATSPDGAAWMQYHHSPDGAALWWAGAKDKQGNGWTANFTPNTPMHLVHAFSAELANPDPVMRPRGRVPHSAQVRTWSVSVQPSQLRAWQQARITAARAATWAQSRARSTRPRTSARPHTPAGGARTRR